MVYNNKSVENLHIYDMPVSIGPSPEESGQQQHKIQDSTTKWTPSLSIHAKNIHARNLRLSTSDLRRLYTWCGNHTHDQSFGHLGHQEAQRYCGSSRLKSRGDVVVLLVFVRVATRP